MEIGILRGESLSSWLDYFTKAEIVAIDTFGRVPPEEIPVLSNPRITWHQHDSTVTIDLGHFDFVIDDGLHEYPTQRRTFENFMPRAGAYFIEDMWSRKHMTAKDMKHPWYSPKRNYCANEYQKLIDSLDPYRVKYHDLRKGHQPDSFIYEITR